MKSGQRAEQQHQPQTFPPMTPEALSLERAENDPAGLLAVAAEIRGRFELAGWLFGFHLGLWFSVLGVLLFSGYVLYDTSRILHHYPTDAHVPAAIAQPPS